MAITSVGYDGIVNEAQWAEMIKKVGAAEYGVVGLGDLKVTPLPGVDRTVSIATGKAWGHGVFDTNDANATIQLDIAATGFRWDLIALRRDWSPAGGTTTIVKINGTATKEIPAGRLKGPGVLDDQPLALVQITAGNTAPTAIVDLRAWAGNGGVVAGDDLVLTYLDAIGTQIKFSHNNKMYNRLIGGDGNPLWTAGAPDGYVPFWAAGNTLDGGTPNTGNNFLIQAGSNIVDSDVNGFSRITFPRAFPRGVLSIVVSNGDTSIDRAYGHVLTVSMAGAPFSVGRTLDFVTSLMLENANTKTYTMVANTRHRVNWIAIGW